MTDYDPDRVIGDWGWTEGAEAFSRIFKNGQIELSALAEHIRAGRTIDGDIAREIAAMIEDGRLNSSPPAKEKRGRHKALSESIRRQIWAFVHVREQDTPRGWRARIVASAIEHFAQFGVTERQVNDCFSEFEPSWQSGAGFVDLAIYRGVQAIAYKNGWLSTGLSNEN